jgi:hypothetical protein
VPSRIIREGWLESERIDELDSASERFFLRLCLKADDFGRFHANPQILKSLLFPLKEDLRSTDMARNLAACEKAGLVRCYSVTGKRYVEILRFEQRLRAKVSKFPEPDRQCQSNDGHVSDIRRLESEAEEKRREAEAEGVNTHPPLQEFELSTMAPEAALEDLKRHFPDIDVWNEYMKLKQTCAKGGTKPTWRGLLGWLKKASPVAKLKRGAAIPAGTAEQNGHPPISLEEQAEMAKEFAEMKKGIMS